MFTCTECQARTELDDAAEVYDAEWCRCLVCCTGGRGGGRRMPEPLRRQVLAVLAACEPEP